MKKIFEEKKSYKLIIFSYENEVKDNKKSYFETTWDDLEELLRGYFPIAHQDYKIFKEILKTTKIEDFEQ